MTHSESYQVPSNWAVRMADSVLARTPVLRKKWSYENGVVFKGLERLCRKSGGKPDYFRFIQDNMDGLLDDDGNILGYTRTDFNLDNINCGKTLLFLYHETGQEKYRKAAALLRRQLEEQPRTSEGGFWHKKIYPFQMWLDGLYMGAPFYAQYAGEFGGGADFDDVTRQFRICREHMSDAASGLYYHAWDEKMAQPWCDPKTGLSGNFWGRAMGWLVMAIVDVLDFLPESHPDRPWLIGMLGDALRALWSVRSPDSCVWYQVLDRPDARGNYREASASCMICYAMAKGLCKGYLGSEWIPRVRMIYQGLIDEFLTVTAKGLVNLNRVCQVAGLGGRDRRDGSFEYYISEPIVTNDFKGVGAFILAAAEMEE